MKNYIPIFIILLLTVLILPSCNNELSENNKTPLYFGDENVNPDMFDNCEAYKKSTHYEIFEIKTESPFNTYYWYNIYDNDNNIVLHGGKEWNEPKITEKDDIVSVTINNGTLANISIYYDINNNILSDEYNNVLAQNKSVICYFSNSCLITTDAFDNTKLFEKTGRDFADMPIPIESAEFIDDDALKISYYTLKDNKLITEIISINGFVDELSSVLSDMNISNAERTNKISKMADDEIKRAKKYQALIKEEYKKLENEEIGYEYVPFDSAYQTLDEYCEYLEKEFDNNIEFFNDYAAVKFQGGTYGSTWIAEKTYECAKDYADKIQALYEYLS